MSIDGAVQIWDITSGECLQMLRAQIDGVTLANCRWLALSHDVAHLALASLDGTIKIWDANSAKVLHVLHALNTLENIDDDDWISSIGFSHNSSWLVAASYHGTVSLWDVSSGRCLRTLGNHSEGVAVNPPSPDSSQVCHSIRRKHDQND